jgi:AraC-like DNA-binding protein
MRDRILVNEFGRGRQALQKFRETTSDYVCEIGTEGALDDFSYRSGIRSFDGVLFVEARAGALRYDRTPRHIARGGIDHYQITLCLDGGVTYAAGRRTVEMRPGDLCLMDMAQSSRTLVSADEKSRQSHALSLLLPRPLLAPLLAAPDGSSASLISRNSSHGRLLAEQFLALYAGNGAMDASRPASTSEALAGVIAEAAGSARAAGPAIERANRDLLLAAVKRFIDANLQTEKVGTDHLCRQFRLSRATLFRLFEPEGGLWSYIQDQRLNRAFSLLVSPASGSARMVDLAVDFKFSSDTTFVRAFRRHFGLTPGEVRRLAQTGMRNGRSNGADARGSLNWVKNLTLD